MKKNIPFNSALFIKSLIFLLLISIITQAQNNNFEISKNLEIYTTLYKELNKNYVDEINPGKLMETGIDAMLKSLDPYTVFIPESEIEDVRFITTGQYGGIGSRIQKRGEYVIISEPYEGFPAYKAGLKAGDKILKINDKSAKNKTPKEISEVLKGQAGTELTITIERTDEEEPLKKELIRENIKIDHIPFYGMLDKHIGYIKLISFTKDAGKDVKNAFIDLKNNNDLKGIIIDVRGNGGGLLHEAVMVSNIFIEKGNLIVSTKGKLPDKNKKYKTILTPIDTKIPVVIMVNQRSASASEIVAGSFQDLDRAVIIGQRTFGKGLVQNVVPISYNSKAKITIAKYYIPSGRCIQEIDYSHKNDNGDFYKIPDSLTTAFKTRNGRTVYDGKGIEPDILLDDLKFSNIASSLFVNYHIFDYATKFNSETPSIPEAKDFIITDEIFEDFKNYISDKDYDYTSKSEKALEDLKKFAKKENYFDAIKQEYEALKEKMKHDKKADINKHQDEIKDMLRIEIIARYYYQKGQVISSLKKDPEIETAIEILMDTEKYSLILKGNKRK
ncbi:MAG: S41 family peptidase [Bacteroidales bacterium]|nr:S41 family peptidase [Bacteroidales bacterium]